MTQLNSALAQRVVVPSAYATAISRRASIMLAALALLASLTHLCQPDGIAFGSGYEMASIARSLAIRGAFADPFYPNHTGPTAVNPPLYPFILAAFMKLVRVPALIFCVFVAINLLVNAVTAALLPRVSVVLFGTASPGVFGAVLWLGACRLMPNWDAAFTALGLLFFCLLVANRLRNREDVRSAAVAGVVAGLLFLANPSSLLVSLPCSVFLLSISGAGWIRGLRWLSVLVVVMLLVNLPWLWRNYRTWGAVVVRTNLGMTLYASNGDCAQPSLALSRRNGCYGARHPSASSSESALLASLGEVQYDSRRTADALHWMRTHPVRFASLTAMRALEFWFPFPAKPIWFTYGVWLITGLSIPGLVLMAIGLERATWLVLAVSTLYPPLYYVVVSDVRYRYPILWLSILPAGYAVHALERAFSARLRARRGQMAAAHLDMCSSSSE